MKNEDKIIRSAYSKEDIKAMLFRLGVREGMTLLVHASLKPFEYLIGGPQMMVEALIEAVGYEGTIVMPLHAGNNSEPSRWGNPPIDFSQVKKVRENRIPFDPKKSDLLFMSKLVEAMRRIDDVCYTYHPSCSFIAYGKYAKYICSSQPLDFCLSIDSPLHKLYDIKAFTLLMNVDYDNATIIHLAESLSEIRPIMVETSAVKINGKTEQRKILEYVLDSNEEFIDIGKRLEEKQLVRILKKDNITLKLFKNDTIVNEGIKYFKEKIKYYE